MSSSPRFRDEEESRYFQIYREEMAVHITGPFTSSLWGRLIPQASEMEPFVRHAVIALGAMAKQKHAPSFVKASDSTYALKQYDESLKRMRQAIKERDHDIRKALIACLLVFCFESLQGNLELAVSHAESGLMLFYQFVSKYEPEPTPYTPIKILEKRMLEGDLIHAYAGLDLHVMFFRDTRPEWIHRKFVTHLNTRIERMPLMIQDAREAREYWFLIVRRNHHFLKIVKQQTQNCPSGDEEDTAEASHQNMECMMTSPGKPPEELKEEYYGYTYDMQRWADACSSLFKSFRESGTRSEKLLVDILCMHTKVTNIILKEVFFSSELDYDNFLPDFSRILSLARIVQPQLLAAAEGSAGFHYGYGVNYPLFLVGMRCRDIGVRDEAIRLLGSRDHREGTWDAKSLAAIAGWVRDIELAGIGPGCFIPKEERVFLTSCNMDLRARKAFIRAGQQKEVGLVFRKALITW